MSLKLRDEASGRLVSLQVALLLCSILKENWGCCQKEQGKVSQDWVGKKTWERATQHFIWLRSYRVSP